MVPRARTSVGGPGPDFVPRCVLTIEMLCYAQFTKNCNSCCSRCSQVTRGNCGQSLVDKRTILGSEVLRPLVPKAKRALAEALASDNLGVRQNAAALVLASVYGKPREGVQLIRPEGRPIELDDCRRGRGRPTDCIRALTGQASPRSECSR